MASDLRIIRHEKGYTNQLRKCFGKIHKKQTLKIEKQDSKDTQQGQK